MGGVMMFFDRAMYVLPALCLQSGTTYAIQRLTPRQQAGNGQCTYTLSSSLLLSSSPVRTLVLTRAPDPLPHRPDAHHRHDKNARLLRAPPEVERHACFRGRHHADSRQVGFYRLPRRTVRHPRPVRRLLRYNCRVCGKRARRGALYCACARESGGCACRCGRERVRATCEGDGQWTMDDGRWMHGWVDVWREKERHARTRRLALMYLYEFTTHVCELGGEGVFKCSYRVARRTLRTSISCNTAVPYTICDIIASKTGKEERERERERKRASINTRS
jgi:hypothetical protein